MQHLLNVGDQIVRTSLRRIPLVRHALVVHYELRKIQSHVPGPILGGQRALQERVHLARLFAVHVALGEPDELVPCRIRALDEVEYLVVRARLLPPELVARERQYAQPPRPVRVVHPRELGVVGARQTSLRRDVYDAKHIPPESFHPDLVDGHVAIDQLVEVGLV